MLINTIAIKSQIRVRWLMILFYVLFFALSPAFEFVASFAKNSNINGSALDTIAGYSTTIRSSIVEGNSDVVFRVEKPDGGVITLQAQADSAGIARADFLGFHTKKAGQYKIYTYHPNTPENFQTSSFQVYADDISASVSTLNTTRPSLEANGVDESFVSVQLKDKYSNAISEHIVELISSDSNVEIERINAMTDDSGVARFKISSETPSITTLIATDITANVTLRDRIEVVFFSKTSNNKPLGGNELLLAELLAEDDSDLQAQSNNSEIFGTIDSFDVQIQDEIFLNEEVNLEVHALDANGNIVKDYTGTINFAIATDENATIPESYTFKESDQGKKIFSLAVKFTKLGEHVLEVYDESDWDINGTADVLVVPPRDSQNPSNGNSTPLVITSPEDGLETGQSVILIRGTGSPNSSIGVFIDDIKVDDVVVDPTGNFQYSARNLREGIHTIYVLENESAEGEKSNTVEVFVDITGATVDQFTITPEGPIEISKPYQVKLISEPKLDEVSFLINGIKEILVENPFQPGTYEGNFVAPAVAGDYPIVITLIDQFQNRTELDPNAILQVIEKEIVTPPRVTGLRGQGADQKILLTWDKVENHSFPIEKYKIYIGEEQNDLNRTFTVSANENTAEVPNVKNGTPYFISIVAVDVNEVESKEKSIIISVTPEQKIVRLRAIASDSQVTLTWDEFPNIDAEKYKVYYGLTSKKYSVGLTTQDNKTTFVIPNLINGSTYFFLVAPIVNGQELKTYTQEASASPLKIGGVEEPLFNSAPIQPTQPTIIIPPQTQFNQGPQVRTGPESNILILASILFAGCVFKLRKQFT